MNALTKMHEYLEVIMSKPNVVLRREEDDPICARASIGGAPEIGYYCVFRGEPAEVIAAVKAALAALEGGAAIEDLRRRLPDWRNSPRPGQVETAQVMWEGKAP